MMRIVNCLTLAFLLLGLVAFTPDAVLAAPAESKAEDGDKKTDRPEADKEDSGDKNSDSNNEKKAAESAEEGEADAKQDDDAAVGEGGKKDADKKKKEDDDAKEEKKDGKADEKKEKKKERKTFTVEPKRLKVDVTVNGTFIAREMTEVVLRPEAWSSFEITDVVEHGAEVKEGDVLIKFDDEKLNESIADLELSQRLSEISLTRAEQELPRLEKSLAMQLEGAERSKTYAEEDVKEYREKGKENSIAGSRLTLKQYRMSLDNAKDELEQLEKMYEADDLTEETEEIVLKRQRQMVEFYEQIIDLVEYNASLSEKTYLPRQDASLDNLLERYEMSLERTRSSLKLDLNAARYQLEQQRQTRAKSLERHAKLVSDRGLMTVKAPASGVVYYGKNVNGKWSDLGSMLAKLKPEKTVSKNQILMTIVDPSELYLYGTIGEKDLPSLAEGQSALATPTGAGADPLKAAVAKVSDVPVAAGKYAVEVELKTDDLPEWLDPGMTGKVKVTTYDNKEALVVPKKAVHTDEFDETVKYVWLVTEPADKEGDDEADEEAEDDEGEGDDEEAEAKVEKRLVRLGKSKGDGLEVVGGLKAGDVISLEDEEKKDDKK